MPARVCAPEKLLLGEKKRPAYQEEIDGLLAVSAAVGLARRLLYRKTNPALISLNIAHKTFLIGRT